MHSSLAKPQADKAHRVSRRDFMKFCGAMATALALPLRYTGAIAKALTSSPRLPVIWLEFQDCTADTESLLRAGLRPHPVGEHDHNGNGLNDPALIDLLLDYISLDYHETLMVPSGKLSEVSREETYEKHPGEYICIVEGSIPMGANGAYCTIGGKSAISIAEKFCSNARATITVGTCAWDGGLPGALPDPTHAVGVRKALPALSNLVNLPGCPVNVVNLAATIVHLITFGQLPATDSYGRPLFAYGSIIHPYCERHHHFREGHFVQEWGDEGHKQGWCLYKMGCKGPATQNNCPTVRWNDSVNWCVGAGHGCIGCAAPNFWDQLTPVYQPYPMMMETGDGGVHAFPPLKIPSELRLVK